MAIGIILFFSAVLAFGMSGITGGGASLLLIPLLSQLLPVNQVPSALVIGTFTSSASRSVALRHKVRWNFVLYFLPAAIPSVILGAWLLRYVDPLIINWICALFLLSNIPFLIWRDRTRKPDPSKTFLGRHVAGIGMLAGLISGITGAVGLLFNGFYLNSGLDKEEIVATRAMNEIVLHMLKLVMYYQLGLFSMASARAGVLIAIASVIAALVMKASLARLSERVFRNTGYAAMTLSGVLLLSQTTWRIHEEKKPLVEIAMENHDLETTLQWQKSKLAVEVGHDGELSFEQVIPQKEVPKALRSTVGELTVGADSVKVEQVVTLGKKYYEVYVQKGGVTSEYDVLRSGEVITES